jgi:hypothetical protein
MMRWGAQGFCAGIQKIERPACMNIIKRYKLYIPFISRKFKMTTNDTVMATTAATTTTPVAATTTPTATPKATAAPVASNVAAKTPVKRAAKSATAVKKAVPAAPAKAPLKVQPKAQKVAPLASKTAAKAPAKAIDKALPKLKAKVEKIAKEKKPKLVRDSFTIPKAEYTVLDDLKQRAGKLSTQVKKSELIRAGIKALAGMSDATFLATLKLVPAIKTGRPSKV